MGYRPSIARVFSFRLFALSLLATQAVYSAGAFAGEIEVRLSKSFHSMYFDTDFPVPVEEVDSAEGLMSDPEFYGRSKLEYPLDVYLAGLSLTLPLETRGSLRRSLALSGWKNVGNPGRKMKDSDWIGLKSSQGLSSSDFHFLFSYTESRSELTWWGAKAGLEWAGLFFQGMPVRLGLDLAFEYSYHEIFGIQGWQAVDPDQKIYLDTLHDTKVLTYRAVFVAPGGHLSLTYSDKKPLRWELRLAVSPAMAMDEDYHLLRDKKMNTLAFGLVSEAGNSILLSLGKSSSLAFYTAIHHAWTTGKMKQEYYGDDDALREIFNSTPALDKITNVIGRLTMIAGIHAKVNY